MKLSRREIDRVLRAALREDLGSRGDVTTRTFVPPDLSFGGEIVAKQNGVLAGIEIAARALRLGDPKARVRVLARDGSRVSRGRRVLSVQGRRGLLSAERVALNFLQRLSGIATLTRRFVDRTRGTGAAVLDTRKTTPLLRTLEKYAVRCGGGVNHRFGLDDMAMIKDNHLRATLGSRVPSKAPDSLRRRVASLRRRGIPVEIEAKTEKEIDLALDLEADIILLDNMTPTRARKGVRRIRNRASRRKVRVEISGGVNLSNISRYAKTGVDRISVGALTHSAPSMDFSLEIE